MRKPVLLVAILLASSTWPAAAQMGGGFAGSTVGLPAGGVPSNPFASNYPSPPPQAAARVRDRRAIRHSRGGRSTPPSGLVGR